MGGRGEGDMSIHSSGRGETSTSGGRGGHFYAFLGRLEAEASDDFPLLYICVI